ncbi:hypothetical protein [Streptomyces brevispora]|uniref:UTRA domain-containing protein n=1 Tax=Streptomyces brevispora TaxID=887462 RepID=A0A561V3U7_9ACTN|nr:hypothetical protein [Streptomyces brevispora]TWG06278.1 hypothetical protein FHX80_114773 [Streptomyces brevispora]WSC12767.1 hypothetical protein OIE64_07900 [Streptomyces brevispora]
MRTLTASTGVVLEYDWWAFSAIGADIADADLLGMPAGPLVREGVSCTLGGEPALYVRRRIKGERARFRAAEAPWRQIDPPPLEGRGHAEATPPGPGASGPPRRAAAVTSPAASAGRRLEPRRAGRAFGVSGRVVEAG